MKLGFIGLGIMGTPMSKNIKLKGSDVELTVYSRSTQSKDELEHIGAKFARSSKELVQNSEIVFTMVPTGQDVANLYEEFMSEIRPDQILVDMSTIEPSVSIDLAKKVQAAGALMLDAPVVKSKAAAIEGTLGIYVGGDEAAYLKVKPLLECMGSSIIYMGQNGAGLVMKICHNMLVGEIQNGVNEMITLAQKFGIAVPIFREAINAGGGSNFYLNNKAENIAGENFPTAFSVRNMHKDVHIAQELSKSVGLVLPGAENVVEVYERAMEQGLGDSDFSASFLAVKR